jgi:transposase InsO family protein
VRICRVIEITTSGYYKWNRGGESKRKKEDKMLLDKIKEVHKNSHQIYGSPRIEQELRKMGTRTSQKRVARLMSDNGLKSKIKKKFKATTNSNHNLPVADNKLNQNFTTTKPNQVWTSDITYIWTKEGWLYLAVVLDLFNRQIIGWKVNNNLSKELVYEAINKSLKSRKPSEGLMFHSDRGVQYASHEVRNLLSKHNITQSMSNKGNCYDNAITETFFHSLKTEFVYQTQFETRQEAELGLFEYIELFYNRQRLHSSLNYLTPVEFEINYFNNK